MALELKLDEEGHVMVQDGKPVYADTDTGETVAYDVSELTGKITALNHESASRRKKIEELDKSLKSFGDLDPAQAREALETLGKLDQKKLIDAGQVDEVKKQITKSYEEKLNEKEEQLTRRQQQIRRLSVSTQFANSSFIREHLTVPPDMLESYFGSRFHVEEGDDGSISVVARQPDGTPIFSNAKPGEPASFDEAIQHLVAQSPHKDSLLRASQKGGAGAGGGKGGGGVPPSIKATATVAEKSAFLKEYGLDAYKAAIAKEAAEQPQ